ncbi:MAG: HAMP domain-containing histidine kinase [Acidobacteria bacterium]|nr:HAMP domain-containing histidine kinase [Acidobacteriota bacterium]
MVGAVFALAAAALLVVYLQQHSSAYERRQTALIIQQACERTAMALGAEVRRLFDGAVIDVIGGLGHPELEEPKLPALATLFNAAHNRFPYVHRFFMWNADTAKRFPDQVLIYEPDVARAPPQDRIFWIDGRPIGALLQDSVLSREIFNVAQDLTVHHHTFSVTNRVIAGTAYQLVVHFSFADGRREKYLALNGFIVDLENVRTRLFEQLAASEFRRILNAEPGGSRFTLTVMDDADRIVSGPRVPAGAVSAAVRADMVFFPEESLNPWLGARPEPSRWRLIVSAAPAPAAWGNYRLATAVVLLMLIALACAMTVDRQAIRLSRMQASFVANVSHQLKTPLTTLSAASETLGSERMRLPERTAEYVRIVAAQTKQVSGLVDQILHFSRAEAIGASYEFQPIDLGQFVETAVADFTAHRLRAGARLTFEAEPAVPAIEADPFALEQVLVNLLDNAVKYAGENNEIAVRVGGAPGFAVLTVRDHGMGIDEADRPHIFEKFYRGRQNGHGRRGFGLGLTIVEAIVRAHGGRVHVTSALGQGSEFQVMLPAGGGHDG